MMRVVIRALLLAHVSAEAASHGPPTVTTPTGSAAAASTAIQGAGANAVPLLTTPPSPGAGTDYSSATTLSLNGLVALATVTVAHPGQYSCMNASASAFVLSYAHTSGSPTLFPLASGGSAGSQGADTSPEVPWYVGTITVYGSAGSISPCMSN
jgi:hypothetical protein